MGNSLGKIFSEKNETTHTQSYKCPTVTENDTSYVTWLMTIFIVYILYMRLTNKQTVPITMSFFYCLFYEGDKKLLFNVNYYYYYPVDWKQMERINFNILDAQIFPSNSTICSIGKYGKEKKNNYDIGKERMFSIIWIPDEEENLWIK